MAGAEILIAAIYPFRDIFSNERQLAVREGPVVKNGVNEILLLRFYLFNPESAIHTGTPSAFHPRRL